MSFFNQGGNYQSMTPGGGGGFMNDAGSPTMDSSQKKKTNRSQTLLPVTGAILHKAEYNVTEDVFRYEGVDIHQVTFVGIIKEVQEAATNISYKVDDNSGEMVSVKKWIDNEEGTAEQYRRSECREDTYVRVIGHMKAFNEGQMRSVIAFSVVPIQDFNEISFHLLDVVYTNLMLTKGAASGQAQNGGLQTPQRFNQGNQGGGINDVFSGNGVQDAGLSGTNKLVYNHITNCQSDEGISIFDLKAKVRNINDGTLRAALEWLSNEGHIYSTIDDDHYKSTAN